LKWKKTIGKGVVTAAVLSFGMWVSAGDASAHGYIQEPASRGYVGSLEKQVIGWQAAMEKYGRVIDSPQSVEGLKGFPERGPADGHIASAEGGLGQIDQVMDRQTADAWKKQDLKGGLNTFTWKYTAPHATSKWHYYITKKSWNPNEPLKRSDFELIGTVNHNGTPANTNLSHKINVPTDRNGYHVILGVWDVADTPNAFYNVIDVNLINDEATDKEPPSAPESVEALSVTDRTVELSWGKSTDNQGIKEYEVYRNGEKIATTTNTVYKDSSVMPETSYEYYIKAIDFSGNSSSASRVVAVTTQKLIEDTEAPTAPSGLHSMKESESSIELMWSPSEDQVGVKEYAIYRDGQLIATTSNTYYVDKNLQPATNYTYTVFAIDAAGNVSASSSSLEVSTLSSNSSAEEWSENKIYTAGMIVQYKGLEYKAKYWTKGNQPDSSDAWELVSDAVVEWNVQKAYPGGSKVRYGNSTYVAQWWTLGDTPGTSAVWKLVE